MSEDSDSSPKMPPVDKTPSVNTGTFELVNCLRSHNKIPVFEYCSKNTGLTVIVAEVEGPIVSGFFCLPTEAFDDDGLPHTLEHLIFLGSEQYPYKGVLDLLANRCLAQGTNAWTDIDHTCYTMKTAGSKGFLSLMPIFLDHILYPLLTDEAFVTEVHHITESGEDAGIVYCEVQGRENVAECLLHYTLARHMYPGHCGYSSETGGLMKNLRESTTNTKVRDYHREFYRPENLKIVITGTINHEDVFKALEPLEKKILCKGDRGQFTRPWQSPVAPLPKSEDVVIKYPCDEEDNGLFCMGWLGPSAVRQHYGLTAISILFKYLTEFPTYTLPKEFVQIDDPYASNVSCGIVENQVSCLYIVFEDTPLDKTPEIKSKLQACFRQILEREDINMERMKSVINRAKLGSLSNLENDPHDTLAFMIIGNILYGDTKQEFEQRMNPRSEFNKLLTEPKSFWIGLLKQYFVDNQYVAVQCLPSIEHQAKMAREEAERIEKQKTDLGESGLKENGKILADAIHFNNREPPPEMLTSVPVPDVASITFHNIWKYNTHSQDKSKIDLSASNVFTGFDHVKTEFVYLYALLDTSSVPHELRIYLPLMLECLFESPIRKNGRLIPYEEVAEALGGDTVSFGACCGFPWETQLFNCGSYSQTATVMLQVEAPKYIKGVEWLRDFLFNSVFSVDRLKIVAARMKNSVSQFKRNGPGIVAYAMKGLRFIKDCNLYYNGVLVQQKFLVDIIEHLTSDKSNEVLETCEKIWHILTESKNTVLHVVGDIDCLHYPEGTLAEFLPPSKVPVKNELHVTPDQDMLKNSGEEALMGALIGLGSIESAFFQQTVDGVKTFDDPDLPALMLYLRYLTQAEGPMWKRIRGKGYSYNFRMYSKPNEGLLYLTLSRSTNVVKAYQEAREIISHQVQTKQWDETLIAAAKSSLIYTLIDKESTIGSLIVLSVVSDFQNVDVKHNRKMLDVVQKLAVEDLNRVGEKYMSAFLKPKKVKTAIVTVPAKVEQINEAFQGMGFNLTTYPTLEESFLNN